MLVRVSNSNYEVAVSAFAQRGSKQRGLQRLTGESSSTIVAISSAVLHLLVRLQMVCVPTSKGCARCLAKHVKVRKPEGRATYRLTGEPFTV